MIRFDIREYMHTNNFQEDGRDILFIIDFHKGVAEELNMTHEELEDTAYYLVLSYDCDGNRGAFVHSDNYSIFDFPNFSLTVEEQQLVFDYFDKYIKGKEIG